MEIKIDGKKVHFVDEITLGVFVKIAKYIPLFQKLAENPNELQAPEEMSKGIYDMLKASLMPDDSAYDVSMIPLTIALQIFTDIMGKSPLGVKSHK